MRLFIAEKPDLAKAIVSALNGKFESHSNRGIGYYKKGDDYITWSFGHLLELYKPDDYNEEWQKWQMEHLPFKIDTYKYKPKEQGEQQLREIVKLINKKEITQIMHCGDADDEGQVLIDEILDYANNTKPVKRVLINDITPQAVKDEIAKARPNSEFKGMSDRGFARGIADWMVGMNLSRAYTCAYRKKGGNDTLRVGRVQTPILSLIVDRDYENDTFKHIDYYTLNGEFEVDSITLQASLKTEQKILDKAEMEKIKAKLDNQNFKLTLTKTPKKEYPPLPYNLLILQTEASKLYGYSPQDTLKHTQILREKHKAISYNRSDCQYLPETIYEQSKGILNAVSENLKEAQWAKNADTSVKGKAFNDKNLSAHYGIIPLNSKFDFNALGEAEKNIYVLIAKRFAMQFYPPREYIAYNIELEYSDAIFTANAQKTLKSGFKGVFNEVVESSDETKELDLDSIKAQSARLVKSEIKQNQTKPRPRYTMTTLLKDLNQVAKYVKNENIKKLLLEKDKDKKGESGGIGTPATRSEMIEKLIKGGFIKVSNDKKQNIQSTQLGKDLIKAVSPMLSNPDMTALWFEYQKDIEKGVITKEKFLDDVLDSIAKEIESIKQSNFDIKVAGAIACPTCKSGYLRRLKSGKGYFYGCSNYTNGCKFTTIEKNGKPVFINKKLSK
ncbi:DNA topoisomerase [Helicobacter cinaedi]|uniref:DNA topoisomerase n=1 Tax=Helicobacter cinaedi TaxID=213 RepID=UPI001EED8EF6|nr:DNA topoisomerase [Helicobacter cinaedi]BDB64833.1 DNA topoisomerase [Helicobacter cinaedi]